MCSVHCFVKRPLFGITYKQSHLYFIQTLKTRWSIRLVTNSHQVATAIWTLFTLLVVGQRKADLAELVLRDRISFDPAGSNRLIGSMLGRPDRTSSNLRCPMRSEQKLVPWNFRKVRKERVLLSFRMDCQSQDMNKICGNVSIECPVCESLL